MRILVAGDTHGDLDWAETLTRLAGRNGASKVIQVGDFGFWPRMKTRSGRWHHETFLQAIRRACDRFNVEEWIVIDGNHDDHYSLAQVRKADPDDDGMHPLWSNVRYSPRGNRFDLEGVRFGTLGGAVSLDAWVEAEGYDFGTPPYQRDWDWFPSLEAPTLEDVERLGAEPLDVLVAHDAPSFVDMTAHGGLQGLPLSPESLAAANHVRDLVARAAFDTHAAFVVHGHWHRRVTTATTLPGDHLCFVEGLASNSRNGGRDARAFLFMDIDGPNLKVFDSRNLEALKGL